MAPKKRGRPKIKLPKAPKLAQVYWCECSPPVLPELGKKRPVVLSLHNTRHGVVTVVPITKRIQIKNEQKYWVKIQAPFDENEDAWVLCNHIAAVSSRRIRSHNRAKDITTIPDVKFQEIVNKTLNNLPERR